MALRSCDNGVVDGCCECHRIRDSASATITSYTTSSSPSELLQSVSSWPGPVSRWWPHNHLWDQWGKIETLVNTYVIWRGDRRIEASVIWTSKTHFWQTCIFLFCQRLYFNYVVWTAMFFCLTLSINFIVREISISDLKFFVSECAILGSSSLAGSNITWPVPYFLSDIELSRGTLTLELKVTCCTFLGIRTQAPRSRLRMEISRHILKVNISI